ncbi:MAG: hypothetical protein WDN00_07025 [Limisphaerales bacterium]
MKFFDAVLARLKQDYKVDAKRIYCTGHSNGGGFTYLLWLARGDVFRRRRAVIGRRPIRAATETQARIDHRRQRRPTGEI